MDEPDGALTADDLHLSNVDRTLRELQRMVQEHEDTLSQLRAGPNHNYQGADESATASLDIMTSAHDAATSSTPFHPFHGSILPALLALRKTHQTTSESRAYATSQGTSLEKARRHLELEKANLGDQRALQKALENRIGSLRNGLETIQKKTAEEVAQDRLDKLRQRKKHYNTETSRFLRVLNKFIDEHLGAMLAAEELGGPIVGDMMDVDTDELGAGFNAQGKPRKPKANPDGDMRQRRIDDIWGPGDGQQMQRGRKNRDADEASAAGAEMRELTELLLNSLTDAAGDSSSAYVRIPKETAAARFLVRSKVAQFHPKDATMLKLVDFGRDLDD